MNEILDKVMTMEVPFLAALVVSGGLSVLGWFAWSIFKHCLKQLESREAVKEVLKLIDDHRGWQLRYRDHNGRDCLQNGNVAIVDGASTGYRYCSPVVMVGDVSLYDNCGWLERMRIKSAIKRCFVRYEKDRQKKSHDQIISILRNKANDVIHL